MKHYLILLIIVVLLFISCKTSAGEEEVKIPVLSSKEETLAALESAYINNKSSIKLSYDYAYALTAENSYEKALMVIEEQLASDDKSLRFLYLKLYIQKQTDIDILPLLDYILSFDGGNIDILLLKAEYYLEKGDNYQAKEILIDIIRRDFTNKKAITLLSTIDEFYVTIKPQEEIQLPKEETVIEEEPEVLDPAQISSI